MNCFAILLGPFIIITCLDTGEDDSTFSST